MATAAAAAAAAATTTTTTKKPLHFLITGAGRGIGRGLSRLLISKGHRVFLVDNDGNELFHTCDIISKSMPYPQSASASASQSASSKPLDALQCNLRHKADIEQAAQKASDFFSGHLDVLINNAANTAGAVGAESMTAKATGGQDAFAENWAASIETNLTAPALLSRACLPMLRSNPPARTQGGCIIHMSSTRALQSEPDSEAYAATKAGLIGLMHSMAVSLAPLGIRVNAILPGWIHAADECKSADEKGAKWHEELTEDDHKWHLTGRVGKVQDVLAAVEYLASSEFVTGTETVVDGGVTRKMVYPE